MIPDGWKLVRFADIAEYKAGRTPARANSAYWAGSEVRIPWVSISDMTEFGRVTDTKEKITTNAFAEVFKGQATRAGTLIMSFKLTIGRVATLGVDACHNEAIISIYPKPGVDQRYLGYFLAQVDYDDLQDRQIKGNTLNQEKIDRIEVWLPPVSEQTSIANVLDLLRESMEIQDSAQTASETIKRAAMRMLFTHGVRGERQKDTEVGPVPESWKIIRVVEEALAISKGASPKWQGFNYVPDGVLFVRSQNVGKGFMEWRDKVFLPPEWNRKESRSILKAGDVLINLVGASIGRSAVGGPEIDGANCNQTVCFVRLRQEEVIPAFLNGFLLTPAGQRQIHGSKKDIARANLSLEDVRQILMPKPDLNEQLQIVTILDAIDRKIELHRQKHQVLERLFKTLLHDLMTGDIRVSELNLPAIVPTAQAVPA